MRKSRSGGMILGKFMPPHRGHVYLVEFARRYVQDLTVVVGTLKREPIPGGSRFQWMRELFPDVNVVHLTDENPQEPSEHPDFWKIWRKSLLRVLPSPPRYVFASEAYGAKLAEVLGARFIPVDPARAAAPVSATMIREDPMANWDFLPRCVRPYYARRVSVFGPESTGKSTLARKLALRFKTVFVPEFARAHLEAQGGALGPRDIPLIARGQTASEEALALEANRVLICDTDPLLTKVWSERLFGSCSDRLAREARARRYDLTLLTDVDVPWVKDSVRYLPKDRRGFFESCRRELAGAGRKCVVLKGSWESRFARACEAVEAVIRRTGTP